jgi:hypothetical protein
LRGQERKSFIFSGAKGVGPSEKDDYYLICRENIVSVLCIVTRVFVVEEVGFHACEKSL